MRSIWNIFTKRASESVRRNSRGFYTVFPRANAEDRLFLKAKITYPESAGQPLFVLSRGNWHCQYQSTAEPNSYAWRNNDWSHHLNSVMITTGLSGSLEPFQLRVFFIKSGMGGNWGWKPTDAEAVFITDVIDFNLNKSPFTIDLLGSDKWYEADSFDKGLLLCGNGKCGPRETEENARRRLH